MLTESELRNAFVATNTAEPLVEGWPGLERFARAVELLVEKKFKYAQDKNWQEWVELATRAQHIAGFYAGLLDECAKYLGLEVCPYDNESKQNLLARKKIPKLVKKLVQQLNKEKEILKKESIVNRIYSNPLYVWTDPALESDPNNLSPHTPGAKLDANKPDCDLIFSNFSNALLEVAKVGTAGAIKYTDNGWESVPDGIRRYRSAIYRHLLSSRFLDNDSGMPHMAHAAWNCLAVLELLLRTENYNTDI